MIEPPDDVDPDNFVTGDTASMLAETAIPFCSHDEFRIDPAPTPVVSLVAMNAFYVFVTVALHFWITAVSDMPKQSDFGVWVLVIGALTCTGVTSVTCLRYRTFKKRGACLIYDKHTKTIKLPHHGISFEEREVMHLQYITTKSIASTPRGDTNHDRSTELNLVTMVNGERKRWPLLRSESNIPSFEKIVAAWRRQTNVPVMRVVDEWLGWKVTESVWRSKKSD